VRAPPFKRVVLFGVLLLVGVALGCVAWHYWRFFQVHVRTDDAYVMATVVEIQARVPGRVSEVFADENWQVATHELLVRLDPADFKVAVEEEQASLLQARERIDQQYAAVESARAEVRVSQAELAQEKLDFARADGLFRKHVLPEDQWEQAQTALRVARARRRAAATRLEQARASLGGRLEGPRYARSSVKRSRAALAAARLNLAYTQIRAPVRGFVSQKRVEVGQWVQPGQRLMTLIPLDDVWVEANFKETQLTHVRLGQPARIVADIYPDHTYRGHVASISSGTGAAFSLLPPQNATGNWVKVVQRLPVKIELEAPPTADLPLRVGLSLKVQIDTQKRDGQALLPLRENIAGTPQAHPAGPSTPRSD